MTDYIKDPNNLIFIGPKGCGKIQLVLSLIGRHIYRSLNPIIILCLILPWNNNYLSISWVQNDDNVWLVEPKEKLFK